MNIVSVRRQPEFLGEALDYLKQSGVCGEYETMYMDMLNQCIHSSSPYPQWYLLIENGKAVGCAGLMTNGLNSRMDLYPWLSCLHVDKEFQGRGLEQLLIQKVKQDAAWAKASSLYVSDTGTDFYKNLGFQPEGHGIRPDGQTVSVFRISLHQARPLVSLVLPVYNREETLERCLDSILIQTYPEIEIIAVNDGSTDRSEEILREYARKDSRLRIIRKPNSGVSHSRNLGIEAACGTYLGFVDSDDWLAEDAVETMVQAMESQSCQLVICDYYRVRGKQLFQSGSFQIAGVYERKIFLEEMMDKASDFYYGGVWNKLYRRNIVTENQIRFSVYLDWCEDFLFNLDYLKFASHISVVKKPVYYYVKTKGSLVNTQTTPANVIRVKLTLYEYYKELYESLDLYSDNKLRIQAFLFQMSRDKKKKIRKEDYPKLAENYLEQLEQSKRAGE